jgi:hypothetical protein
MAQFQQYVAPRPKRYSLHGLVTAVTALLVVFAALDLLWVGAFSWRGTVFDRLADGGGVSDAEASLVDGVLGASGVAWIPLALATAVVFIIWQFRHGTNARTLGVYGGLANPGWAIGGWFIPIANFFLPARQIFRSSRPPGVAPSSGVTTIVVFWAIAFWLSRAVDQAANNLWVDDGFTADDLRQMATSDYLTAVSAALELAAAVLAIVMVRTLTKRQNAAFDAWMEEERAAARRAAVRGAEVPGVERPS